MHTVLKKVKRKKKAFSIAEAMVVLLITSLALAAASPLISKSLKSDGMDNLKWKELEEKINQLENNLTEKNTELTEKIEELKEELDAFSAIPSGSIVYFDLDSCPSGWTALTSKYPKASNAFIRNTGGSGRTRGSFQQNAAPNITGVGPRFSAEIFNGSGLSGAVYFSNTNTGSRGENGDGGWTGTKGWNFDASRSASAYGRDGSSEIRPDNIAFLACRKN